MYLTFHTELGIIIILIRFHASGALPHIFTFFMWFGAEQNAGSNHMP